VSHISTLKLHQFRYGELDADASALVRSHVDGCDVCRGRLQAQEAVRAEVVARPVPEALRVKPRSAWWRPLLALLGGGALVAATALVAVQVAEEKPVEPIEVVRSKGDLPAVEVWVADDGGAHLLGDAERLGEGDRVQLQLDPRGARWVTVAGVDGTGEIEIYDTWEPEAGGLQAAPFALELDDAPGPQHFWVIGTDDPPSDDQIRDIVSGRSNIPGARTSKVTIGKE
jgi:hypothetical protein